MNGPRETVEEFLARGEKIEYLPRGQCNWDALTDRAKINPTVREDELAARRQAQKAAPPPPAPPKRKNQASRAAESKPKRRPELAPQLQTALDALVDGDRIADLAEKLGKKINATWQLYLRLQEKGKVHSQRQGNTTTWHKVRADG